jgi:tetratricopeptide (TPR) repeat protein
LNRVRPILIAALLAGAAAVFAQDLRVEYLDGLLEVEQGGRWREAHLGETVPAASSLRLAAGSLAELAAGELRVTLHQPGTYAVGALLRASRQSLAWGLGRLLQSKIRALFSSPSAGSSRSGGARAGAVDAEEDPGWMDEEEEARKAAAQADQDAVEQARVMLTQGRAAEAAEALARALEQAEAGSRPYLLYLLASARFLEGRYAAASQALEQTEVPRAAPYYPEYALLKGRLLMEGQAYREALALFDALLAGSPAPATAQPAWFLSAFCSLQLGDPGQARRRLENARRLDPGSELGSKAGEMLSTL